MTPMLISCPNCDTQFSVPDKALGATGRSLKCAKCGHKWFQTPAAAAPAAPPPARPTPAPAAFAPPPPPAFSASRLADDLDSPGPAFSAQDLDEIVSMADFSSSSSSSRMDDDLDVEMDNPPIPDLGLGTRRPDGRGAAEVDLSEEPQPIPDIFSTAPAEKRGTGGLWFLLLLMILGGLGGAGYFYQDMLVQMVPEVGPIMEQVGLRHEKPGAGLELRKVGPPERLVLNETEVLIVRGVIANITDRPRPVPTMKLVLVDKDKNQVQEKIAQPPVTSLEPNGTAGFRIILDRPDATAVEALVLFVDDSAK